MEIVKTFYLCALQGNIGLLKDLQKYHSIDVNISDHDGTTCLILASANNQYEIVRELISMGADVNQSRNSGNGPLFFACQSGYSKIVKILLENGANPNQENCRDKGTSLLIASQNGHSSCVELLLEHGAKVDHQLNDGATSLFLAAQSGHLLTLELLLHYSASVNLSKKDFTSPLYISSQMGHHKIVKCLLEHGADVDAAREDGSTSLFKATQKGHRLVIEALLKKGASTSLLANGDTALHMAALFGRTRISHLLLVNGADPLQKNKDGISSSEIAKEAQFNDLSTVLESYACEKSRIRRYIEARSAPCSLSNAENSLLSLCSGGSNNYSSTSNTSSDAAHINSPENFPSNTTGSNNTVITFSGLPHLSAPAPLPQFQVPPSKLYRGFLPPRNETELIAAIQHMAKPSVVQKEPAVLPLVDPHDKCYIPSAVTKLLNQARHSNPDIREIEQFRSHFPQPPTSNSSNQHHFKPSPSNPPIHPSPPSYLYCPTNKPVYLKTPNHHCNCSYYIPPLNPPPPLPIPPQINSYDLPTIPCTLSAQDHCLHSNNISNNSNTVIIGGRRKLSQPNIQTPFIVPCAYPTQDSS